MRVEADTSATGHRAHVDMMNCDELVERVTDYLEDALPPRDLTRLDNHIGVCAGCVAHVDEVRVMVRLTSSVPSEPMSTGLQSTLLAIHRRWAESVRT